MNEILRGPDDKQFALEVAEDYDEFLLEQARRTRDTQDARGLVAILRSNAEFLTKRLVHISGFDSIEAYDISWDVVWSRFESALNKAEFDNPIFFTLDTIAQNKDRVFRLESDNLETVDAIGLESFHRNFGAITIGNQFSSVD